MHGSFPISVGVATFGYENALSAAFTHPSRQTWFIALPLNYGNGPRGLQQFWVRRTILLDLPLINLAC